MSSVGTAAPGHRSIAVFSSARRHGNTGQFIDFVAGELGIETIDLASVALSPFDYEHRNRHDGFEPLMRHVLDHDQLVFASPVYWYTVTATMKLFLDRLSDYLDLPDLLDEGRRLRGKHAYIVCTSICEEPPASFISTFVDTFEYLGMRYGGYAHANCEHGYVPARHQAGAVALIQRIRSGHVEHAA